jgi:hypothetical protein
MMAMEKRVGLMKQIMGIFCKVEKNYDGSEGGMMTNRVGMIFTKIANVQQYFVRISYTEFHPNWTINTKIKGKGKGAPITGHEGPEGE